MEIQIPQSQKKLILNEISPNLTQVSIRSPTREVKVGTINKADRQIVIFRVRDKHLHMRTNSYGFNNFLIQKSSLIDTIKIIEDNSGISNTYIVSRRSVLDIGSVANWIDEEQIFVTLEYLERFCKQ